jgi:hypothetical protein
MSFNVCRRCHKYSWREICNCIQFKIIDDDCGDDEIYAQGHEYAAISYAKKYNENGDHNLMDAEKTIGISDGLVLEWFRISADQSIDYSANLITEE